MSTSKPITVGSIVVEEYPGGITFETVHNNLRPVVIERAHVSDLFEALRQYIVRANRERGSSYTPPDLPAGTTIEDAFTVDGRMYRRLVEYFNAARQRATCSMVEAACWADLARQAERAMTHGVPTGEVASFEAATLNPRAPVRDASGEVAGYKEIAPEDPHAPRHTRIGVGDHITALIGGRSTPRETLCVRRVIALARFIAVDAEGAEYEVWPVDNPRPATSAEITAFRALVRDGEAWSRDTYGNEVQMTNGSSTVTAPVPLLPDNLRLLVAQRMLVRADKAVADDQPGVARHWIEMYSMLVTASAPLPESR